jgi:hypothetical protein
LSKLWALAFFLLLVFGWLLLDVACLDACRLRAQSLLHACQTDAATFVKAANLRLAAYVLFAAKARTRLYSLDRLEGGRGNVCGMEEDS